MQAQARSISVQRDDSVGFMRLMWLAFAGMLLVLAQSVAAQARSESLAPLAEKISPAVVNITTSTLIEGQTGPQGIVPEGSPFEDFFREFQDRDGEEGDRPRRSNALGSGFVTLYLQNRAARKLMLLQMFEQLTARYEAMPGFAIILCGLILTLFAGFSFNAEALRTLSFYFG